MLWKLFLLFTIMPVVELYLLIKLGGVIGAFPTVAIILLTGLLGAYLARQEGFKVIIDMQKSINHGQIPGSQILHGVMILIGAATLITPGFVTDLVGFSLLFPPSRRFYLRFLLKYLASKIEQGRISINIHRH